VQWPNRIEFGFGQLDPRSHTFVSALPNRNEAGALLLRSGAAAKIKRMRERQGT